MVKNILVGLIISAMFILIIVVPMQHHVDYYEYIDLSDDVGIAEQCYVGRGGMHCYLEDGRTIQVKEFKPIRLND